MVDLKSLETFICVTELSSFCRAAERLHTTQPAISQRIARLEQSLGARLLEREGRSVVPTAQGRQLLDYARRMLSLRDELIEAVGGACALSGVIRIGSAETLVHTWLPEFIRSANTRFPRLNLEMEVDISPRLIERLMNFDLDIAFMTGPPGAAEVMTWPIATYPVAFIASPSLGWKGKRVSLGELARWPIVTFPRRTQPFHAVESLFRSKLSSAVRLHASASLATATQMALDGTCIAAIPPVIVQAQLARGELEIVDVEEKLPDLLFCAAWHPRSATKAVRALIELAERLSIMEKGAGFDGRVVGQANREAQLLRNSEMSTQNCDV